VFAVGELDHAGDPHEVDPRAEVEAADDGRSGQDQHRYAFEPVDHGVRDGPATTQVAEAKAVVTVDQDPCVVESFHVILYPLAHAAIQAGRLAPVLSTLCGL